MGVRLNNVSAACPSLPAVVRRAGSGVIRAEEVALQLAWTAQ